MANKNQLGIPDTATLVTPHDSNALPLATNQILGIMATGAGNIVLDMGGTDVTVTVAANEILRIAPTLIKATLTTATGIHLLS